MGQHLNLWWLTMVAIVGKQCSNPPMTGNGNHTTYLLCFGEWFTTILLLTLADILFVISYIAKWYSYHPRKKAWRKYHCNPFFLALRSPFDQLVAGWSPQPTISYQQSITINPHVCWSDSAWSRWYHHYYIPLECPFYHPAFLICLHVSCFNLIKPQSFPISHLHHHSINMFPVYHPYNLISSPRAW